jgi:hypothetical protein
MSQVPTQEDSAKYIISIFSKFSIRPGQVLMLQNFYDSFSQPGWQASDFKPGMDYALEMGWVEIGPNNFYTLTDKGSQVM